jgi:putative ABC transport system permease protein
MALGASGNEVGRLIVREGMKPAVAGVMLGVLIALLVCRLLKSMLFGIGPLDPLTFVLVAPLLLAVSFLACYLPAVRATRINPVQALRSE